MNSRISREDVSLEVLVTALFKQNSRDEQIGMGQ